MHLHLFGALPLGQHSHCRSRLQGVVVLLMSLLGWCQSGQVVCADIGFGDYWIDLGCAGGQ